MKKIKKLLEDIKDTSRKIQHQLSLVTIEIENILLDIKVCENLKETDVHFNALQYIQRHLAELIFNNQIQVSDRLWNFVKKFDRLDDPWLREHLFNAIKSGQHVI